MCLIYLRLQHISQNLLKLNVVLVFTMEGNKSSKQFKAIKNIENAMTHVADTIIVEEALQININGKPYTITMRTPGSDKALIRGLFFTEGIYSGKEKLKVKTIETTEDGILSSVNVWIPQNQIGGTYYQSRSMLSVSSCGICGKRELDDLMLGGKRLKPKSKLDTALLVPMFETMRKSQVNFEETGGSHAAAAFDINGRLLAIEEDIGRHNAVDKVIGNLLDKSQLDKASCMLVSGRVSFEIVSKTYKAGIPYLAAVSSPSSLSIETAEAMGITLLAFCRGNAMTCYSNANQLMQNINQVLTP